MSQNDAAVLTAAVGYVFVADPGAARPTPAELAALDPESFGSQVQDVSVTGAPTGGTFTLTVGGDETAAIAYNASADAVAAALAALASVGSGNVQVTGTSLADGYEVAWIGAKQGEAMTITADDAGLTGGTSPAIVVALVTSPNGWVAVGHTSRGDMPEFGFDGGDTEVKGTWQNESLREVVTDPIADYLTLYLHQFDTGTFELYYGVDASADAGVFGVANGSVAPVEKAFLLIIVDGSNKVGFYSAKASVRRDDSVQLPVDEFAALPVRATFLKHGTANKFEWISQTLFA